MLTPALLRLLGCCLLPQSSESGQVVAASLGVMARVLLHNGAFFLQMFEGAAAAQQPGDWGCKDFGDYLVKSTVWHVSHAAAKQGHALSRGVSGGELSATVSAG